MSDMSSCRVMMPGLRRQRRQFETSVAAGFLEAVVQKSETMSFFRVVINLRV